MKRFLFIVISLLSISSVQADDIEIGTASQLREFATSVNAGEDYVGMTVKLTADIDLNNEVWMPIGTTEHPFLGTFDGQGHWVDHLIVDVSGFDTGNVAGLFGCVGESGTVSRVGVRSGNIYINGKTSDDASCYVGGIAGLNQGHIFQCSNFAIVIGNWRIAAVGGIAGGNGNIGGGVTSACIEDCYNRGRVFTSATSSDDINFLGGIVGLNDGTVRHVYSSAEVSEASYYGGIFGYNNQGTVESAYATGDMLGFALDGSLNTQGDYSVWQFNTGLLPTLTLGSYVLVLEDDADNATSLTSNNRKTCDVVINGRTLYKDNSWNTLTLPFAIGNFSGTVFSDATVMELVGASFWEGTLTLDFNKATSIVAGRPYFVKWNSGEGVEHIVNPAFSDVTINGSEPQQIAEDDIVSFKGIYSPFTLSANDRKKLYLSAANTLYFPSENVTLGAFRAYFELLDGLYAGTPSAEVNNLSLNFNTDEVTTILRVDANGQRSMVNGQWSMFNGQCSMADGQWYTLDGRHLKGKPVERGFYIHQGKKVLVK